MTDSLEAGEADRRGSGAERVEVEAEDGGGSGAVMMEERNQPAERCEREAEED